MQITFKPVKGERGKRSIYVDGIGWGWVEMHSHGPNGTTFSFRSVHSGTIQVPYPNGGRYWKGSNLRKTHVFTVKGDKLAGRQLKPGEVLKPLEERLRDGVRFLIEGGHLKHPDTEAAENEARAAKYRAERDAVKSAAEAELEAKAAEVVSAIAELPQENITPACVRLIVDAMKWAQTR